MASHLEKVPYDILLDITILSAAASICRPPAELLSLLLTSQTLYHALNVGSNAHLYARLFQWHFDLSPLLLRSPMTLVNDATLADEYILRQRFLFRSRNSSWDVTSLRSDMWIGLRMLLENNGTNGRQLFAANFPQELIKLALIHIESNDTHSRELKYLLVWLLSLTLSKGEYLALSFYG
ncbi:hypothetical protein H1R20_g3867, partial [Candolleomyces eurysporus]